jgi:hypothetical protein
MGIKFKRTEDNGLYLVPVVAAYFHSNSYCRFYRLDFTKNYPIHFHLQIIWLFWYFEIQIGKDYKE